MVITNLSFCIDFFFRLNKETSNGLDENGNTIQKITSIQDFSKITMKANIFKAVLISPGKSYYEYFKDEIN